MSTTSESLETTFKSTSLLQKLHLFDWLWAVLLLIGGTATFIYFSKTIDDMFELGILALTMPSLIALGWFWKPLQKYLLAAGILSLISVWIYSGFTEEIQALIGKNFTIKEILEEISTKNFFLKYFIASQTAIMWMSALIFMATIAYWIGLLFKYQYAYSLASSFTWSAALMGLVGLLVRWRESYLVFPDYGHIPVSNLYEVFVLFVVLTALLYLFYEAQQKNKAMGAFALLVISAAVGFLLWYTFERQADSIQPLIPALQSYWMKIHVPANFIGYGAFALAAMLGIAYLIRAPLEGTKFAERLPTLEVLDDVMYKSIALGFGFFTIATILGAMWAAEAWGGYWSWDPKETWALIVWLNYAAWLHMRLTVGWRGSVMSWWAVIGLFITLFAFLGVNMFLSGLHSYGAL